MNIFLELRETFSLQILLNNRTAFFPDIFEDNVL